MLTAGALPASLGQDMICCADTYFHTILCILFHMVNMEHKAGLVKERHGKVLYIL